MVFAQRISRRQLLKVAGAVAATAVLDVRSFSWPASAEQGVRSEWTFSDGLPAGGVFETPELRPDTRFDAVDVSWRADAADAHAVRFELRTQTKDGSWSDWLALHPDGHAADGDDDRRFIAPVPRSGSALQVRATIDAGAGLHAFTVGTLDAGVDQLPGVDGPSADALLDGFIIPRAGWGANEAWRHEGQDPKKPVIWPPRYQAIEKIIIHHTVTENDPANVKAMLRSIYYYHAITRGWGDIGYNFLVDWSGNVYEGRFGGPNVIGGHALQYNRGSIGIALLGSFDSTEPPEAMLDGVLRVIAARAAHVDVTQAADFIDLKQLANLCGHRDVMDTSCPGEEAYPYLPLMRGWIAGTGPVYFDPPVPKVGTIKLVDAHIGPAVVYQGNLLELRVTVRNPTDATIASGGPDPGYIYDEDQTWETAGFPKVEGEFRFCLDVDDNTGTPNPWRWGFGEPLAPGEEREVVGYVRLRERGTRVFSVSIVKEFVAYLVEDARKTEIVVDTAPVGPRPQSNDPAMTYFDVTGINVPRVFMRYWEANGGLRRFGYPLTEAFEEVSETDGGTYLTQYFERARFEYHPEYAGTKDEVLLGLLGNETTRHRRTDPPFLPVSAFSSSASRIYFPETGHSLSGIFLQVWNERGGLPIYGYPISEPFPELSETDGNWHMVQYFERNRFEHHQDYAGTYDEVMFGHLAREILIRRGWLSTPDE